MEQATAQTLPSLPPRNGLPPGPSAPAAVQTARLLFRPVQFAEACHDRYGDTFRAHFLPAGDVVFISDPDSLKRLFSADRINTIAPGRNFALGPLLGPGSLLLQTGDEHLRRRKLMLPSFHGERMRAYESAMEDVTERELATWPLGEPFALHSRMQAITLEVILRAVFGVGEERHDALRDNLVAILATTRSPAAFGMTMSRLNWIPRYRRTRELIAATDELLAAEVAERRSDPHLEEREDILSMLVAAQFEDGSQMDGPELRDQLMTLLLAGHETTATALAWTFELLYRSPEALERASADARDGDGAYLDAVATEALRLRPVVPFTGRQLNEAAELGGHELPAGMTVFASIWLAHTREASFPQARSFRPERFLDGSPETYSWIPFGGGTRRCIGAAFAQLEMRVVLRTLLREVVLGPADDRPERIVRRNVTLAPARGTPTVLRERLAA
jgi:cytochrome P450